MFKGRMYKPKGIGLRSGLYLALTCISFTTWAQHKPSKKAEKRLNEAIDLYMSRDVSSALERVDEALRLDTEYSAAWMLKSQLCEERGLWECASHSLGQAFEFQPSLRKKWHTKQIRLAYQNGQYDQAFELLETGEDLWGVQCKDSLLVASVRFAHDAVSNPLQLTMASLEGDVNTAMPEYYPALFATGDRMIFTRQIGGDARLTGQEDFFEATEDAYGNWRVVRGLNEVNTPGNEGAPTVRGDGRQLVFTACAGIDGQYVGRFGEGSCDLFKSTWSVRDGRYHPASNIEELNSRAWESQPSLSADGHWLYYVRAYQTESGKVIQDIYRSEWNGVAWGRPHRLPPEINSPGREENPVLHPDGKTLYFASNGHAGMGGMDLYVSRMQDDGTWSPAVNLGYPINTSADENSLQVFPDGRTALFATDRDEPGNLDLWKFSLPEFAVAEKVNLWRGEVVQALDGAPVQATVVVIDINGKQIGQQLSDATDGQFTLSYPSDETVTLQVKHPDYAFYSRTLDPNSHPDGVVRIELTKLEVGTIFVLQDVRFARSSFELDDAFQPDLSQLASTLLDTDIRIRIIGHTDNEGSLERNQQLSEQRAQSVADYLVGLGIDPNRIETEGRGETVPIADNSTEQGRALNRRTEVIVID